MVYYTYIDKERRNTYMQVTNHQAFFIARSLYKGINSGNTDVSFSVFGDGVSVVGVKRKRSKYMIYVMQNGKFDKSVRLPLFNKNIDVQDLADNIQQAIEESVFLQDKELDTSKKWVQDIQKEYPEENESQEEPLPEVEDSDFEEIPEEDNSWDENDDFIEPPSNPDYDPFGMPENASDIKSTSSHEPSQVNGFDILTYVTNSSYGGSISDRVRNVAEVIADWDTDTEGSLEGTRKENFVRLLSSIIEALMFETLNDENAELRKDTFYVKDLFNFFMKHDSDDIKAFFKKLSPDHHALTNYAYYSYITENEKSAIMQSLIMRMSNYATDEFESLFDDLLREMDEADKFDEESLKENVEMKDTFTDVDTINLETPEGEPNAYVALSEPVNTQIGEAVEMSQLAKQMNKRASEFSDVMKNVFMTIVGANYKAAEDLYIVAMAIALRAYNGDADKLAEALNADPRDIIMADYEYQIRKNEIKNTL